MLSAATQHNAPSGGERFARLKRYLIDVTGLHYYADKDDDLAARIDRRLAATHLDDLDSYLELLRDPQRGAAELDRLVEELTVGETSFFRHAELFDGLRDVVLPDLLERNRERKRLRIWCAGCSTGAEPYSVSIMLRREFGSMLGDWDVSILGTDINRRFLEKATEGVYRPWDFRGAHWTAYASCFEQRGDDWAVRDEFRTGVHFQYHNLVQHPFPSLINNLVAFDLILCRNVLIYFSSEIMRRMVGQFYDCLVESGWLLVGHAEPNVEYYRQFDTVNVAGAVLYRRPAARDLAGRAVPASAPNAAAAAMAPRPPVARPADQTVVRVEAARRKKEVRKALTPRSPAAVRVAQACDATRNAPPDLEAAAQACERMIAADPMNANLHLQFAMLKEQLGHREAADISLRRAIYLKPDSALAHYFQGLIRRKQVQRTMALRDFDRVLELLEGRPDDMRVDGDEQLSVGELRRLARMQKDVLAT